MFVFRYPFLSILLFQNLSFFFEKPFMGRLDFQFMDLVPLKGRQNNRRLG